MDNSARDKAREPFTGNVLGEAAASPAKKPYKAPSFRFEPVFEVSALACGKVFANQGGCAASRKAS